MSRRQGGPSLMVSREAQAALQELFDASTGGTTTLAEDRANWDAEVRKHVIPEGARFWTESIGGIATEIVEAPGASAGKIYLLLHGGGYVNGSPRTHRRMAAHVSAATGRRVITPDYRLAPEHPFPAGLDDALAVYRRLRAEGHAAADIAAGGDSAGGGLALSLLLALREAGEEMPGAAVLLSPWTDLTVSSRSYAANGHLDPIVTQDGLRRAGLWYAGDRDPADPMLSPLFADLSGLPPMLIHAGSIEAMLDDSRLFVERARAAGVEVTYREFEGLWHVFHASGIEIPESRQAIAEIGSYLRALQGE